MHFIRPTNNNNILFALFSAFLYVLYLSVPLLQAYTPQPFRYMLYLTVITGVLVEPLLNNRYQLRKIVTLLVIIALFTIMMYLGKWKDFLPFYSFILESLLFWAGLLYMEQFVFAPRNEVAKLGMIIIVLMAITLITTMIGNFLIPNASRIMASNKADNYFSEMNIGGYEFVYGTVIILPYLLFAFRNGNAFARAISSFMIILIVLTCFYTEYTTAMIVCLIVLAVDWIKRKCSNTIVFFLIVIGIVIILLNTRLLPSTLLILQKFIKSKGLDSLYERVVIIREAMLGNGLSGDAQIRNNAYKKSFEVFLGNPLIGGVGNNSNIELLGGHSELLEILGGAGLIGIILFVILLYYHISHIRQYVEEENIWPCMESMLTFLAIAGINTVLSSAFIGLCLFLGPVIIYTFEKKKDTVKTKKYRCKYFRT